jgi:hypothetical protein
MDEHEVVQVGHQFKNGVTFMTLTTQNLLNNMARGNNRLSTPCYEHTPNARYFFDKIFHQSVILLGQICLLCHMTSVVRLEIMMHHTTSIICDFHFPVDFWLDLLFPHIFWFLHQNRLGIGGFALTPLRKVGDEEKTIPSCLDTSSG